MTRVSPPNWKADFRNLSLWLRALASPHTRESVRQLFDAAYYAHANPEVVTRLQWIHYLLRGFQEGRSPSPAFDNNYYLTQYPDVANSDTNPLLHYVLFGEGEGRVPYPRRNCGIEIVEGERTGLPVVDNSWPVDCPLVSVVIPCFNYGRYLREALESVEAQTFRSFEVLIVEAGSTDAATSQAVAAIEQERIPNVRVLWRGERHLVGDNRNFGIAEARGRYICCLDADDRLKATYLEIAVFLAEVFAFDIVSPSLECFGSSDVKWLVEDPSFPAISYHNQIATAALFRKQAWERAGGFRDWGLGAEHVPEDWDFWVRLLGHGCRAKSVRETLMTYRVHNLGLTATTETSVAQQRATIRGANRELLATPPPDQPRAIEMLARRVNVLPQSHDGRPGVLLALPWITIGGAEQLFHTLLSGLRDKGYLPVVVTTLTPAESVVETPDRFADITPHVYRLPRLFDVALWPEFLEYLVDRYRVESVIVAGSAFVYQQLKALRERHPSIRIVDQQFNETGHIRNNRRFADLIDTTVVPSQALATVLTGRYHEAPDRVRVIPHGIDTRGPAMTPELAWQASGLPAAARGRRIVGFFGRLSEEKAPDVFLKIAARLAHRSDLFFVMTGDGPQAVAMRQLAAKLGLERALHMPGFVANQRPLMQLSDIVVLPSSLDGMPLAVLEAGAFHKPVVASRVGSLPEMVLDGETGIICPIGDVKAFVRAVERLADSADLRRSMGERARTHVLERFDSHVMVEAYLEVLAPAVRAVEVTA